MRGAGPGSPGEAGRGAGRWRGRGVERIDARYGRGGMIRVWLFLWLVLGLIMYLFVYDMILIS